jgi:outer membrane protein assembly factor BamB
MSYAAGAAVIGLVVAAGSLAQPVYGSEAPYGGTHYADVRSTPTPSGWTLPLAREFAPGVPGECLTFRAGGVDARHELLAADPPSSTVTDQNPRCGVASPGTRGRLVMVDPATGRVLWRRNLEHDLGSTVRSLIWRASASPDSVVVGIVGSLGSVLLSLDVRTGKTVSSTGVDSPDEAINFAVSGHVVVSAVPDTGGAVETFTVRRSDALSHRLWRQSMSSVLLPELLPDRFVVPLPGGTVSVDGRTGRQTAWRSDLRDLQGVVVSGDRLVAQTIPRGVGLAASVVSLDRTGKILWTRPAPAITGLSTSRNCVMVSTGAIQVTCLDPDDGRERWTTPLAGAVSGTPDGSTTNDVESIGPVHSGDTSLRLSEIDGENGRVRFVTSVPRGADIVGQSVATGYALGSSSASGDSTLTAFDLDSGRTLWSISRPDLGVWGGELVEITSSGLARALVDPGAASGRNAPHHAMLVG